MNIKPNFDVDMDKIGWYDSNDKTGGNIKELVYLGRNKQNQPLYKDERKIKKYYSNKQSHPLFIPKY